MKKSTIIIIAVVAAIVIAVGLRVLPSLILSSTMPMVSDKHASYASQASSDLSNLKEMFNSQRMSH